MDVTMRLTVTVRSIMKLTLDDIDIDSDNDGFDLDLGQIIDQSNE